MNRKFDRYRPLTFGEVDADREALTSRVAMLYNAGVGTMEPAFSFTGVSTFSAMSECIHAPEEERSSRTQVLVFLMLVGDCDKGGCKRSRLTPSIIFILCHPRTHRPVQPCLEEIFFCPRRITRPARAGNIIGGFAEFLRAGVSDGIDMR